MQGGLRARALEVASCAALGEPAVACAAYAGRTNGDQVICEAVVHECMLGDLHAMQASFTYEGRLAVQQKGCQPFSHLHAINAVAAIQLLCHMAAECIAASSPAYHYAKSLFISSSP